MKRILLVCCALASSSCTLASGPRPPAEPCRVDVASRTSNRQLCATETLGDALHVFVQPGQGERPPSVRIDGDDPQTDVYVHGHTTDVDVEGAVRHLFACAAAESVRVRAAGSVASLAVHNDDGLAECRTSETWMTIVGQPELGVLQLQRRTRVQWDLLGDLPDVERVEVVDSDVGAPVVVELSSGTEDLADVEKLASIVDAFLQAGPAVELTVYVRDDVQAALQQRFADDNVAFGAYR